MPEKIIVSGVGCCLVDLLFNEVDFGSETIQPYLSQKRGDGGLTPGQLVFVEEFEKYSKSSISQLLDKLIGGRNYDKINIGGPSIVSLINAAQLVDPEHCEVRFYGRGGNDEIGKYLVTSLEKTPVVLKDFKLINKPNPSTVVLSDPSYDNGHGERIFINSIGAAWEYRADELDDDFFNSDVVAFGGTALVPQIHDYLTALLKRAKNHNCITIVNTVFDFRNENIHPSKPWPIGNNTELSLSLTDILIMDSEEAIKISGKSILSDAAMYFSKHLVSSFLITNGTKEIIVYSNGTIFEKMDISRFPVSLKILTELQSDPHLKGDTTGCGDNFAGGVIANTAEQLKSKDRGKLDLIEALSWGVASGGFACYYLGGTFYEKKQGEKLEIIKSYQIDYLKQIDKYEFIDK